MACYAVPQCNSILLLLFNYPNAAFCGQLDDPFSPPEFYGLRLFLLL